jgi:hypothetical protein
VRQRPRQARTWLARDKERSPKLFPHWQLRRRILRPLRLLCRDSTIRVTLTDRVDP